MDDAAPMPPKKRPRREAAPTTPDPIEIAMEAEATGSAPEGEARLLLADHRRLIGWEIADKRAGFVLKLLLGAAGVAAAVLLAFMAWTAAQDRSLIIDAVGAPEDMVRQGASGEALAHALQDKLARLQAETTSQFVSAQLREKDKGDLKVVIPQTGVSLVELNQALREWLGRQTHVSAEVSRPISGPDAGALVLTARVGAQPGIRLVQKDGDLDALLAAAAERLYADVDPLRHAQWLTQHGRDAEAVAALQTLSASGPDIDRAQALYILAGAAQTDSLQTKRDRLAQTVQLSRGKIGVNDLAVTDFTLGHAEMAYRGFLKAEGATNAARSRDLTDEARTFNRLVARANVALMLGDLRPDVQCHELKISPCSGPAVASAIRARPDLAKTQSVAIRMANTTAALTGLHDIASAAAFAAAPRPEQPSPAATARLQASWLQAQARLDVEREDWQAVLRDADAYDAIAADYVALRDNPQGAPFYRPIALAALGDAAAAERAAMALPSDCYRCLMVRGRVAAMRRDWAAADRWYGEAARQGPSVPQAEAEWGQYLLAQGKPDAAIAKLSAAHRKGPRFADPLEVWGEALLAKGDAKRAAAKFAEAGKLAPQWGRLHLKWGEALANQGKAAEAQAQFKTAAGLFLTASERAELARLQGGR